jgi:DnaJ-class molecular chaperone
VKTGSAEFAAARLPSGDDDAVVVAGETEAPHEVLGVAPDAPEEVIEAAARRLKADNHPDSGGSREEFQRIVNAEEAMLSGGEQQ